MKVTKRLEIAKYAKIVDNKFNIPCFTIGKMYKVYKGESNYYWPEGEPYVLDDNAEINYTIWMVCKTILYV